MKKLILLFIILLSGITTNAQEYKQFTVNYSNAYLSTTQKVESCEARVFFNYGNMAHKIKMYVNGRVNNFSQISITRNGEKESVKILDLLDDNTGEEAQLSVYLDDGFKAKILFDDGSYVILNQ